MAISSPCTQVTVPNRHAHRTAVLLVVTSSVLMSFGGLIVRNIEYADNWKVNLYRGIGLAAAVTLMMLIRYRGAFTTRLVDIGKSGVFGGVLLALAGVCYLQSITNTTVANTLFILSAIPFIASALAWLFLKERLQLPTLVAMLFACAGIVIMLGESLGGGSSYGNGMALLTAFSFASYAVVVRRKQNTDMLPAVLVSALLIVLVSALVKLDDLTISRNDLLLCLLWGAGLAGIANWMFIVAIRHLAAAEVTLIMLLEFALGPIWVWWFVNEIPSNWTLLGGALVITSVGAKAAFELSRLPPRKTWST